MQRAASSLFTTGFVGWPVVSRASRAEQRDISLCAHGDTDKVDSDEQYLVARFCVKYQAVEVVSMQIKYANRDELAWAKGELAYAAGDTMELAMKKATDAGFRPGSNGYAAFITAFSRQVRNRGSQRQTQACGSLGMNTQVVALDFSVGRHPTS